MSRIAMKLLESFDSCFDMTFKKLILIFSLLFILGGRGFSSDESEINLFGVFAAFKLDRFEAFESEFEGRTGVDLKCIGINLGSNIYEDGRYEGASNCASIFREKNGRWFSTKDGRNLSNRRDLQVICAIPLAFVKPGDISGRGLSSNLRRERLLEVAAGEHDLFYENVAKMFVKGGHGNAILRLGHEFNGWDVMWLAENGNEQAYINAWRHVHGIFRKFGNKKSKFLFDYNMDRGGFSNSQHIYDEYEEIELIDSIEDTKSLAYPGSDYVDIIGCDVYDNSLENENLNFSGKTQSEITEYLDLKWDQSTGAWLNSSLAFALKKGKPFSIPEWGLWKYKNNSHYIQRMNEWIENNKEHIYYTLYFNYGEHSLVNRHQEAKNTYFNSFLTNEN